MSDVSSHTPQRISVFALQTCVRKKALWGHTGPAPTPLSLGQPNLFRLPRARLQVPSALGEEDTRARKGGKGHHRARLLLLTHIYSAPSLSISSGLGCSLSLSQSQLLRACSGLRPRSTPLPPPPAHGPFQHSSPSSPPPGPLFPARARSSVSLPPTPHPNPAVAGIPSPA